MRLFIWFVVGVILIGGACFGIYQTSVGTVAEKASTPTPRSNVAQPSQTHGIGYIEPAREVRRLAFKSGGVVAKVYVSIGQTVKQLALVMELDNAEQKQAVRVFEQQLVVAKADEARILRGVNSYRIRAAEHSVHSWNERVNYYQKEVDRNTLLVRKGTITQATMDELTKNLLEGQSEFARAEAELAHLNNYVLDEERVLAAEQVRLAQMNLEMAKERLENTRLYAPMNGTVLEILKREGESLTTDNREPVIIFADLSELRVRAEFDERNAHAIREGQAAKVFGRNVGDRTYPGRVTLVKRLMGDKTVFARTATERKDLEAVQAFIEFEKPVELPVGLRVDVSIVDETSRGTGAQ